MVVGFGTSSEITGKNRQDSQLASTTDFEQVISDWQIILRIYKTQEGNRVCFIHLSAS
nr:hypothetical protein [Nostoc sp. EkiNYC01]